MTVEAPSNVASNFLASMFGASTSEPVYICSLPNDDARDREPSERRLKTREPTQIDAFLKEWDRRDRAVYFCTATVKSTAKTRSKQTIAELNSIFVDIDFKDISIGLEEIEQKLRQAQLLPSKVVASGHGFHAYWIFKESLPATTNNIERIESLLRLLADHLGGDLACAEASRLMRLPGTHNSKGGCWTETKVIADRPLRYEIDELTEWLEVASPIIHRKPQGNGHADNETTNPYLAVAERFGNKPPIDVEQRLAAMTYQGPGDSGIHATHVSVTAALLNRGRGIDETVEIVLTATRAAAGPFGERWNWRREERAIRGMCESWVTKHPGIITQAETSGEGNREHSEQQAEDQTGDGRTGKRKALPLQWHGDVDSSVSRSWLVRDLLPETGKGLVSGQWGLYKTFVVLDLAAAVMAGETFIHFPIVRRGGVLFIAAEGATEIPVRLQAVIETKYSEIERMPFAWTELCPRLLGHDAANILVATQQEAADRMQAEFGLPLALIVIDTLVAAAGFSKAGDENDAAVGQIIMNVLESLSQRSGALVLGIDHFGKTAETGTRGTSAKEGSADVVLALLGNKSISGAITGTRLATRKRRGGPSGQEFPFSVRPVDMGIDQYGARTTSLVIDWKDQTEAEAEDRAKSDDHWSKSLRLLRQVLMNVLVDHGSEHRPFPDGPVVRAVDLEVVRQEFQRSYPADGDAATKQAARRKAFRRAITAAQERNLIGVRDVGGITLVWLANVRDEAPQ
jgi:hypothetical protein